MSLIKNSSIVIIGVLVSNILAYAFHFVAGRWMGPESYGEFGALMAIFMWIALPAASLGIAITKFTSIYFAEKNYQHIGDLRRKVQNDVLLFSFATVMILMFFSKNISAFLHIKSSMSVIIVGLTLVGALILPINRGVLQGMKKYKLFSWNGIVEALIRLLFLLILLYYDLGVNGAIFAYGFGFFLAFLLIFPSIKEAKITADPRQPIDFKPIYSFIFKVLLVNFLLQSLINGPTIWIKHYYTSEFTGYWTAALNIARISFFVSGAISVVMFPEIAGEKIKLAKKKIYYKATYLVLITTVSISILFFVIPELFIVTLYGKAYLGAVPILQWMGVAMIFIGILQLWCNYMLAKMQ
ncbi:MAG: oligosaccharide flippase family protein [Saprospiraceae bacterium]